MRVGIIAPPWVPVPPPSYGGTEQVIDGLARGLQAAGHDVLLWTTGDATCPVQRGYVLPTASGITGLATTELHHAICGHRALERWGADIAHDHTLTGPVYALSRPELPTVTTLHGELDPAALVLYGAVGRTVPVIAISEDQASRSVDVPIAAVIHHGIDLQAFPMGLGTGDDDGHYFAFLGRMAPQKGVHLAAQAARETGQRLVIAAKMREEPELEYFAVQVRPLLGDGITFLGEADDATRIRLLQGATALVNPIQWPEPFGLVMVEALACGTPVITMAEGSAPELVRDGVTGFVCHDVDELAKRLADVEGLDRATCRADAEARFSLDRMVADHVAFYRQVLAERAA